MSFFGRLFGSSKAGEKLVSDLSSGVDKMFYTSEEKADDAAQARREGYAVYMEWLKSTTGSRIARRVIAFLITVPWAIAQGLSAILDAITPFVSGIETVKVLVDGVIVEKLVMNSEKWTLAADSLSENASQNNGLIGVVLLFYFGGPAAIDGVKGLVNKWVGNPNPAK
jgi:hypothetical protein